RDDDDRTANCSGVKNLDRNASVGKSSEDFDFVLRPKRCGKEEHKEQKCRHELDYSHRNSLRELLGALTLEGMRTGKRVLPAHRLLVSKRTVQATTFPLRSTLFFPDHA